MVEKTGQSAARHGRQALNQRNPLQPTLLQILRHDEDSHPLGGHARNVVGETWRLSLLPGPVLEACRVLAFYRIVDCIPTQQDINVPARALESVRQPHAWILL